MTDGTYATDTNDMLAVHDALLSSLGSADELVAGSRGDPAAVATASSFLENVVRVLVRSRDWWSSRPTTGERTT